MKDGNYREALGKWEAALNLMPGNAVLHEQKAQVLLEIGDAWSALKAATREFHVFSSPIHEFQPVFNALSVLEIGVVFCIFLKILSPRNLNLFRNILTGATELESSWAEV